MFTKSGFVLRLLLFVVENLKDFEEIQFTVHAHDMSVSTFQILTCLNIRKEYAIQVSC